MIVGEAKSCSIQKQNSGRVDTPLSESDWRWWRIHRTVSTISDAVTLNALVDTQMAWFEQVLSERRIDPAQYPDDLPGVRRFRDGMLLTAQQGSYEQIVTMMFGAEWMYYFWCKRVSEHRQSDADIRRWVEMHSEDTFYQQALWLKDELDRCAMALSEKEKQALSALYGDVLQWEIDFHHAAYEE